MITVGFSRSKKWYKIGSRIIAFALRRPYSHAYFRYKDPVTNLQMVSQASHGFINEITYHNFLKENVVVEEISYALNEQQFAELLNWCKSKQGNKYATDLIISIFIKKLIKKSLGISDGEEKFICSEYVIRGLLRVFRTLDVKDYVLDELDPSDLNTILKRNLRG
jgi:hypothetical protein